MSFSLLVFFGPRAMPKHRSTNALLHVKNGQRGSSSSWPSLPSVRIPVSICGPILEPVTPVTAPINIGPSSPLRARKISSCYDLENHKTLANIDLLRPLRPLHQKTWCGGEKFKVLLRPPAGRGTWGRSLILRPAPRLPWDAWDALGR